MGVVERVGVRITVVEVVVEVAVAVAVAIAIAVVEEIKFEKYGIKGRGWSSKRKRLEKIIIRIRLKLDK